LFIDDAMRKISKEELPDASTTGALRLWLFFHLDRVYISANRLRSRIFEAQEQMDKDVSDVPLVQIIDLKQRLLHILSVAEEQHECMESLAGSQSISEGLDFEKLKGYLGISHSIASPTERSSCDWRSALLICDKHTTHTSRIVSTIIWLSSLFSLPPFCRLPSWLVYMGNELFQHA
jgi:hypothetical protein